LGEKKLEEELLKYQMEVARRDRLGPFLGQILMNTSCLFEDATTLSSLGTTPDMQSVASFGGQNLNGNSTSKRPAVNFYKQKLEMLKNQAMQADARIAE
jgi:hypothetical protein